jgi:hypothetical protein
MWHETRSIFLEAAAAVLRSAARILPSVFAMMLLFGLAAILAYVVRWAVRRACAQLGLAGPEVIDAAGAIGGTLTALLCAPASGEETRRASRP